MVTIKSDDEMHQNHTGIVILPGNPAWEKQGMLQIFRAFPRRRQAITLTSVDLSSARSSDIYQRVISQ